VRLEVVGIFAHGRRFQAQEIVASPAALATALQGNKQALVETGKIRTRDFVKAEPIG
jgi:hypothetical protein